MANILYPKFKEALLQGFDLAAATLKVMAVNATGGAEQYAYNAAHDFLNDVPAGTRVATSGALTGKTYTNGVFDANDLSPAFGSLAGQQFENLIIFDDTGDEATSRVVLILDTATGLPLTPNGNNIDITWNASGIFAL